MSNPPTHRERLVQHFASFGVAQRRELAALYGARLSTAEGLAELFIGSPERVRAVIRERVLPSSPTYDLMEELAYEHDLFIDVSWSGAPARRQLADLGLVARPAPGEAPHELEMVGAIAAVVAPFLRGVATTIPTLLAARDDEYIDRVARAWDITAPTQIEKVLRVSQHLGARERADDLVTLIGAGDYVGAALMALELGGSCYWQEVFGHDLDQNPEFGGNVVAFMRSDERAYEQHIADTLLDHGVIFRLEADRQAPLAVVPEELWTSLWTIGRAWMTAWTSVAFTDLREAAVRRAHTPEHGDFQAELKWFACEADRGQLATDDEGHLTPASEAHVVAVGGHDPGHWRTRLQLALELSALRRRKSGELVENPTFRSLLDMPKLGFVRQVLFEWCTGYVGARADAGLPEAVGLDESWRQEAIAAIQKDGEFVPVWMHHEGVEAHTTGGGWLRNAGEADPEQLVMEMALTTGLIWLGKVVWLDLLSLLDSQMWYPKHLLVELLQLSAGHSTFSQLTHVLEAPNMAYYLPVQRASLMSDEFSAPQFEGWLDAILDGLLVPLGVAALSDDREMVWLQTAGLRIESPPGLGDDARERILQQIFDAPDFEFRVPRQAPSTLHRVDDGADTSSIDLDRPLQVVRDWLGSRPISRFDGRRLHVAES